MHAFARRFALPAAVLAAAVTIHGCGDDTTPAAPDNGQYGSVLNADEFENSPQALPVAALRDPPDSPALPPAVMLKNLPAIAQQGTWPNSNGAPGTCEAQSFGYGLGGYTAARAPDGSIKWDPAQPANQVSAAFEFAVAINNGYASCPGGSQATPHLSRLASFGSPSASEVPYQPRCEYFYAINVNKAYPDAQRLRIGSFATFTIKNNAATNAATISRIEEYLANQQAVAFSGTVYSGYGSASGPPLTDGYFYADGLASSGGHGQLLVGYDMNAGAKNKTPGMLLVQNSFGNLWPDQESKAPKGMLYWSYQTFLNNQSFAAVAYPYDPSPPKGVMLASTDPKAPVAAVERAFQWSPSLEQGETWLILWHHIAEPIRITSIALTEPGSVQAVAIGKYGQYISSGYTYLRRADAMQFLPGDYTLKMQALTLDGTAIQYTGVVTVGSARPASAPPASMKNADNNRIYDTLGQVATVSP